MHIKEWCARAQLQPNPGKTKIMDIVTSKSIPICSDIIENGNALEKVDTARLLGITLSKDPKWDCHVNGIIRRASRRIFSLITLRSIGTPANHLWYFYCAAIRSILLYAFPAWSNCGKGLWDRLNKVERRALRVIGSTHPPTLRQAADKIATRLMKRIQNNEHHPMGELIERVATSRTRQQRTITAPWTKTSRLPDSFIMFADQL